MISDFYDREYTVPAMFAPLFSAANTRILVVIAPLFLASISVSYLSAQSKPKPRDLRPCSEVTFAPEKLQRPSPPGCADTKFADGSLIVIQYSRPKLRNPDNGGPREVFGFTVPYGSIWRAGANEATSFISNTDLMIDGKKVPAGAYTLYIVPERRKPWQLILSKTTGQWGMPYPGRSTELARFPMDSSLQRKTTDQFTIVFESQTSDAATLSFEWEGWRASATIAEQH